MSEKVLPDLKKMNACIVDGQHDFHGLRAVSDTNGHELDSMENWLPHPKGGLCVRPSHRRWVAETVADGFGRGLCVHEGTLMLARGNGLYRVDGQDEVTRVATLTDTPKQFVSFGRRLLILPDRVWYDPAANVCRPFEVSVDLTSVTLHGKTVTRGQGSWAEDGFQVGDGVHLVCPQIGENDTYRITALNGEILTLDRRTNQEGSFDIQLSRRFPAVTHMCAVGDRLVGCGEHAVYVSEKGNPCNWYADAGLGSAAPVQMEVGDFGRFTGCACWQGYALFFKADHIYKMMGSGAGSYLLQDLPAPGVAEDATRSLRMAGGSLYYWSAMGLCRYDGGYPECVSRALDGDLHFPCGGGDGEYYYLSGLGMADASQLYVLHTRSGEWFRWDARRQFCDMVTWDGRVYGLEDGGAVWQLGNAWEQTHRGTPENELLGPLEASMVLDYAACRWPIGRKLRGVAVVADTSALSNDVPTLTVSIQYDAEETWQTIGRFEGRMTHRLLDCPVMPRACDFYRLRLETVGEWRIKAIYRVYTT